MPPPLLQHKIVFLCHRKGGHSPPLQRHKTRGSRNVNLVCAVPEFCVAGGGGLAPTQNHRFASGCWGHLDLDTCLTPEAKNRTDLNYTV